MMMKQRMTGLLIGTSMLILAILLAACSPQSAGASVAPAVSQAVSAAAAAASAAALPTFTAEELAKYDGKNGNPAYIAVNGIVYDVSNVPEWKDGSHWGRFQAGQDLSEEIKLSPHGTSKLKLVPIVGTYLD